MIGAAAIVYGKSATHGLFVPGSIQWSDAPNALPAGAKLAVLEGDPFKPVNLGMGEKFDMSKASSMPAGTFGFLSPKMKHYAFANEPTVIQLHGEGPWEIVYVNPADDPRSAKKK